MPSNYFSTVPISLFPMDNYNQQIDVWISPNSLDYNTPLLSSEYQTQRLQEFFQYNFGSSSPWDESHINYLFSEVPDVKTLEEQSIASYSNQDKSSDAIGYGENFRPHTEKWIDDIAANMNTNQFNSPLVFDSNNRAIFLNNADMRVLPTQDVHFYNFTQPGQGYPFDNLQITSIWAGTAAYIVGVTQDNAWVLVVTSVARGWVKSEFIARVDQKFVSFWTDHAKESLAAIVATKTPIIDQDGIFRFLGYIGAVFPTANIDHNDLAIYIPVLSEKPGYAAVSTATLLLDKVACMPLSATPSCFAKLFNQLVGRPYGWGNAYFFNDCSAELKNLFTPFGIWLPRQSSDQLTAGKMVDMSDATLEERLNYLSTSGRKLMTIVYIGSHIFLYLGNYPNQSSSTETMVMSYQNIWGLSPADHSYRQIIGGAVFFPILSSYPENSALTSLADKTHFEVVYLDEWPSTKSDN